MAKKNPDGKKSKNSDKANKGDKNTVVKAPKVKVQKPKGPVPDFTPRAERLAEVVQTDLNVIWNGWLGLVEHQGVRFRVVKEQSVKDEHEFRAVYVVSAPAGSPLAGLSNIKTYITVAALHAPTFASKAEPGSKSYDTQERIWEFLDKAFREQKIKGVRVPSASKAVEHKHEKKASASVADFNSRKQGLYRFDTSVPYAIISVEPLDASGHAPQFGNPVSNQLVIKLISVGTGHPLSSCMIGTYLYYNEGLFANGSRRPAFKGSSAKDCSAFYEYLAGVRSLYRQSMVDKLSNSTPASEDVVVGERVDAVLQAA